MKNINTTQKNRAGTRQAKWLWRAALAGLTLAASVGISRADVIVDQFDNATGAAECAAWVNNPGWGITAASPTFTSADAQSSATSGSAEFQWTYTSGGPAGVMWQTAAPAGVDLTTATFVEFDLMVDPASGVDNNGNICAFQGGAGGVQTFSFNLGSWGTPFTKGVWQHFKLPISPGTYSGPVSTFYINPWGGPGWGAISSPTTMIIHLDNLVIDVPPALYPDYVAFAFDNSTTLSSNVVSGVSGGTPGVNCTGAGWYGEPTTVAWDATKNSTISHPDIPVVAGSGSMHVKATYDALNLDNGDVIALAFNTNYFGTGNWPDAVSATNVMIDGTHYASVDFDILWDTNLSTMSITNFNSMGDIMGVPMGLLQPAAVNGGSGVNMNNTEPAIPDAASNGWVHMSLPIPKNIANLNEIVGLYFKKWGSGGNGAIGGTAAYWIDNVVFVGGPLAIYKPTMSISEPAQGLNIVNNSGGGYDRESLLTLKTDYSWVDQPNPVTYSIGIAGFPGVKYSGYDARLYLVPSYSASEAEPDWGENYLAMITVYLDGSGKANATIGCKDSQGGSGNGDLYDSTNPVFTTTNSPIVGTWSFTFSHNTNILVTAPDGEHTNWILPLLTSSELESDFGDVYGSLFGRL